MLCTGISCTGGSFNSSVLFLLNSAILRRETSGAWFAYCFQLVLSSHGCSVTLTISRYLQFRAPAVCFVRFCAVSGGPARKKISQWPCVVGNLWFP